ncbi:hypothetical protein TNCV_918331 [Trichonephila clavipes]|nr:hypothetical protein TNCV_918331 [Trichonephila clavipes]
METALKDKTSSDLFEQFYSSQAYDLNANETMRYVADVANDHDFLITVDEIRFSIAMLLRAGYHSYTCERDYWSYTDTLKLPW